MDWDTLIAVVIGGLIGIVSNYFTNHFQLKKWEKERGEQRREAKIQLALEMTRDDIKILEGAIDNYLKMLDILAKIRRRNTMGHLSTEEMLVEMKTLFSDENSQFNKLSEIDMIGAKLAHTFGDEFILE